MRIREEEEKQGAVKVAGTLIAPFTHEGANTILVPPTMPWTSVATRVAIMHAGSKPSQARFYTSATDLHFSANLQQHSNFQHLVHF